MQSGIFSRRWFVTLVLAACGHAARKTRTATDPTKAGFAARPRKPSLPAPAGLTSIELTPGSQRGLLYVPGSYAPDRPVPLLLLLHGARGGAQGIIVHMTALADAFGFIILAPEARGRTWDIILSGFGPDITAIDEVLDWTFERCAVDAKHLGIGGFSDGASYALSVGLANGDLFTHILAFSPGFMVPPAIVGRPGIFVSHGTRDDILPIDPSSRVFAPNLKSAGYRVRYREFDGPHTIPDEIAREAVDWFTGS
ncbi:MAG TPA: hypothetical protein VIT87_09120 [Gemmatimonadales bacterium]